MRANTLFGFGVALVAVVACGGDDGEPPGSPGGGAHDAAPDETVTVDADAVTQEPSPEASPTPAEDRDSPTPGADNDPNEVPDLDRATGTAVVSLDGATVEMEIIACGWLASTGGSTRSLSPEENRRDDFRLNAVADLGQTVQVLTIDRDGRVGATFVTFLQVARDGDPTETFVWANERQRHTRVEVDGNRISTREPLVVLEDPVDFRSPAHELTVDATCETFGGIPAELPEQVSTVTGLPLPTFEGTGTVTFADETYAVVTTECDVAPAFNEVNVLAESEDGSVVVSVKDRGPEVAGTLSDVISLEIDGTQLIADQNVDVVRDGDVLATTAPVPMVDLFTREATGMASVSVTCG